MMMMLMIKMRMMVGMMMMIVMTMMMIMIKMRMMVMMMMMMMMFSLVMVFIGDKPANALTQAARRRNLIKQLNASNSRQLATTNATSMLIPTTLQNNNNETNHAKINSNTDNSKNSNEGDKFHSSSSSYSLLSPSSGPAKASTRELFRTRQVSNAACITHT